MTNAAFNISTVHCAISRDVDSRVCHSSLYSSIVNDGVCGIWRNIKLAINVYVLSIIYLCIKSVYGVHIWKPFSSLLDSSWWYPKNWGRGLWLFALQIRVNCASISKLFWNHDDVIKWKHLPRYRSLVQGEFHSQRPVTRCFDVSFDLYLNKSLSKLTWVWRFEAPLRSLWLHCNLEDGGKLLTGVEGQSTNLTDVTVLEPQSSEKILPKQSLKSHYL